MSEALDALDRLTGELREALAREDWQLLAELNGQVASTIEPVMQQLERGELSPAGVQKRLQVLQEFCSQADTRAREAKQEAQQALKSVNQNNSAARAYRDISSNSRK